MKSLTLIALAMLAVTVNAQTNVIVTLRSDRTFDLQFQSVSNAPCKLADATNWCDRIPASEQEQAVKDLAVGGVICKVLGHSWASSWIGVFDLVYYPGGQPAQRKCHICGKVEIKTEEWK